VPAGDEPPDDASPENTGGPGLEEPHIRFPITVSEEFRKVHDGAQNHRGSLIMVVT
jgi:hypothetical protein